jgi:putative glutathione S-transferase
MGIMIDGVWHATEPKSDVKDGAFKRPETSFRNWITVDGSAGPTGKGGFAAEHGRYHLYISHACPWAHRAMIFRALKGLQDVISVSVVHWIMAEHGWTFVDGEGVVPDPVIGADYLHQVYKHADANFSGRITVPVLWDLQRNTVVSNESSEIIRMLNSAFNEFAKYPQLDFHPEALRSEIDPINERIYRTLNNGVYRSGFARSQEVYDAAVTELFDTLDWLEDHLSTQRYLAGGQQTEADWRLFTTLLRFDPVYYGHFKCNIRRLVDYPNLWNYTRDLYQTPGVTSTIDHGHIQRHYYASHESINPTRIVPLGPVINFDAPHNRTHMRDVA